MTIDHIGFIFHLDSIYRIIGRLAFPLFAFLIYQGFLHTNNRLNYFKRLFVTGIIIEVILIIAKFFFPLTNIPINIFLTLSFGLACLSIIETNYSTVLKIFLIFSISITAEFLNFDYGFYGVILISSFYLLKYHPIFPIIFQILLNIVFYLFFDYRIQYFALFAWVLILIYDGTLGKKMKYKYILYLYYPLHLLTLYLINIYL